MTTKTAPTETTAPAEFPTFYEWITADEDRKLDYEFTAVNHLPTFGMTGEAASIIRDHADSAARDFSKNTDPENISGREADNYADVYKFETYDGPTRAALIHWAWTSRMDLTESGPLEGGNIWEQIEQVTWDQINSAARQALAEYADHYADARQEWIAHQPCQWSYSGEDDGLHWWDCETHGDSAHTEAPDAEPVTPCDSAETGEQEADK